MKELNPLRSLCCQAATRSFAFRGSSPSVSTAKGVRARFLAFLIFAGQVTSERRIVRENRKALSADELGMTAALQVTAET